MSRTAVEQIKEKLSIIDVVGGYCELTKAGKNYKAKSPFTNEKTPSFYVSPDRGMYYCFSSQKGGDMFTFIQEMEGVDFKGALKILAEQAHVELVQEDPKKRDDRETAYALLEEATQYFFKTRDEFPHINEYIESRGVKGQTVHAWRIGYAKDEWRALKEYLLAKGFSEESIFKAGLIKKADGGKESYDVFRDRIMFPIFDPSGRVVAFSGRTLKKEDGVPKYVNSPETELFQKSEILYGYDKAKQGIRNFDFSLVVEGQFDVVLSHQAGYTNAVAVSGTAFTKHHMMLLSRFSPNVVLALDADRAGISAMKRSAVPLLQHGMNVKVAQMPEGKDPADVVRSDPQDLKKIVGSSVHVIEFFLAMLKVHAKDERGYKLQVREEILPLLVAIDNRIDREHFEGIVATAIDSTREGVHYEVERLSKNAEKNTEKKEVSRPVEEPKKEMKSSKRVGVEMHIRASMQIVEHVYPWLFVRMQTEIKNILEGEEYENVFGTQAGTIPQADIFNIEHYIETVKEKQLAEELAETLTQYAHMVAKERLGILRKELAEASSEDGMKILEAKSKEAEKLLQTHIVIEKA
jgi:DNA primase